MTVRLDSQGLNFEGGFWPWMDIRQTQGAFAGEVVRLERGGHILIIPDRRFLLAANPFAPHIRQQTPDARGPWLAIALAGGVTVAVVVGLLALGLPYLTSALVEAVPVSWEESLGQAATSGLPVCPDVEMQAAVNAVAARLESAAADDRYRFKVSVSDDPTVNAFAAPGGYIVLFRGLLRQMQTPEEAAGVLAHEMQHVLQRHSTRGMVRTLGVFALITLLFGDPTGIAGLAGSLGNLSFQRGDEEAADIEGLRMLQRARIDAAGMIAIYGKLAREAGDLPGGLQYLSTHPNMTQRVERLKRLASEQPYSPAPISIPAWAELAKSCK